MKKRARSVLASTLITALVAMTPTAVLADTAETKANTTINVYVDGYYVPSDVPPMIDNDRVFIPMRAAAEAMGANVEWDNVTRSVSAQKGDISAYFLVGSKIYTVNDEEKRMMLRHRLLEIAQCCQYVYLQSHLEQMLNGMMRIDVSSFILEQAASQNRQMLRIPTKHTRL